MMMRRRRKRRRRSRRRRSYLPRISSKSVPYSYAAKYIWHVAEDGSRAA